MDEQIVMKDSPEAAQFRTDVRGWVSRSGWFFGEGAGAEAGARHDGCTHHACAGCGAVIGKHNKLCLACRSKDAAKRYAALPRAKWDGKAMLYSEVTGEFYGSPEAAGDDLQEGQTLADLQVVLCTPNFAPLLTADFFEEQGSDDWYLPDEVRLAMDAFNKAVSGIVLSWSPSDVALDA